jgi:hypothetical protein
VAAQLVASRIVLGSTELVGHNASLSLALELLFYSCI